MVTGAKKVNFPKPGATKQKEDITMVDAERMLVHYNQDHPGLKSPAKRVTQKIIDHTGKLAIEAGWAGGGYRQRCDYRSHGWDGASTCKENDHHA